MTDKVISSQQDADIEEKLHYISLIDWYIGLTQNEIKQLKRQSIEKIMQKYRCAYKQNIEEMDANQTYMEKDYD